VFNDGHFADNEIDWPGGSQWQRAFVDNLRLTLGSVLHRDNYALGAGDQVHRPAHPRHHFSRDHPICQKALRVHLEGAEQGDVDMPAADEPERHGTIERARARQSCDGTAAGVGEEPMPHALLGYRARADQPVLGLEEYLHLGRHVVRNHGRDSNTKVDQHARSQFLRDTLGDDGLRIHGADQFVATESISGAGVITWSSAISPTGTMCSAVTIVVSAAIAMTGLKFRAVRA